MKQLKKLCILCALTFALSGCLKSNINLEITRNGDAKISLDFLVQEETLTSMGGNIDLLKESFSSELNVASEGEITFTDLNKTIDEQKWVGFVAAFPKGTNKEFKQHVSVKDNKVTFEINSEELKKYSAQQAIPSDDTLGEEAGVNNDELIAMGMESKITIKMPGKITESSIGDIKNDTVVIDMMKDTSDSFKVVCELSKNDSMMIYIGIGIGAIVILGAIIFFAKKGKNTKIVATNDTEKVDAIVGEVEADITTNVTDATTEIKEEINEEL